MRINTSVLPQLKTESGAANPALEALSAGDAVSAQVVTVIGDRLTLRFPGGSAAAVTQKNAPALSPGDTLELLIKDKIGGQTFVEITGVTPAEKGGDLTALLLGMGLSADEGQLTVARELLDQGFMLTRENVSSAAGMLSAFKTLTAGQTVFMVTNSLPANDDTAARLSALLEHKCTLGGRLMELLELLDGEGGQNGGAKGPGGAAPLADERTGAPQDVRMPPLGPQAETGTGTSEMPGTEQAGRPASSPSPAAAGTPPSLPQGAGTLSAGEISPPMRPGAEPTASALRPQGTASMRVDAAATFPVTVTEEGPSPSRSASMEGPSPLHPGRQSGQAVPEPSLPPAYGGRAMQKDGAIPLPHPPGTAAGDATARLVPGNTDVAAGQGGQSQSVTAETVRSQLLSLFRRISGDPQGLSRSLNARRLAEELSDTFAALREHARSLPPERQSAITATLRETEQSLDFLSDLSQFGRLVQIPVQLGDHRTTAELCVFQDDQGGRRIDPKNVTLFLSLATAHMGRVEAFVRIIRKNVECDFNLPDDRSLRMMRENAAPLYSMLEAEGYRLTRASFTLDSAPSGLITAGEKKREADRRFRIDLMI